MIIKSTKRPAEMPANAGLELGNPRRLPRHWNTMTSAFVAMLLCASSGCGSNTPAPTPAQPAQLPDFDSSDEIVDVDDRCPLFLECEGEFEDFDGCPDPVLLIDFTRDSVMLDAGADKLLAEIATELIARKRVAALRLDGSFAAGESPDLAGTRAAIVRQRLMDNGVPGSQLTTSGLKQPVSGPGHVAPVVLKCR